MTLRPVEATLLLGFLLASQAGAQQLLRPQSRPTERVPCESGSCYPGTGNLLIGREDRLYASSTCGLTKQEKYCIVSHLEKHKSQQCFWCDARNAQMSHNVSNIVDIKEQHSRVPDPWWQSENGVENVYIQLNMETEFHFTHLMINFKTFRPAAMIIERSHDYGKTWKVYRYFASSCETTFRNISTGRQRELNDVVCDNRYSSVNPSTGGELIFRVLSPNIPVDDPFSDQVQELVKMTNLRINFTKLHTLGDNLLDQRNEILEKYYYAINHMIVRGSCSCYGHASVCLPLAHLADRYYPRDMVHGQCLCTHNTKGPNCKECEDFYNDLRWKAAYGKSQNACKRCNCNNHATACEFNEDVFKASGNVSGGVCTDCAHNTEGVNCERCKPFFYHEQRFSIQDPHACHPCDCKLEGTVDNGVCDQFTDAASGMVSGQCHCKENVGGRRCDRCKEGFWSFSAENPLGCQPCRCNLLGTENNAGCDVVSGECTCKRNVIGRDCNQCPPGFWGLSEDKDGCKPCDCDVGGAFNNLCDVITGECRCRRNMIGRTCDKPDVSHFTPFPDFNVYEAELATPSPDIKIQIIEPNRDGREVTWTGTGYMRTYEGSRLEFSVNDIPSALNYDLVIRYAPQYPNGWDNVTIDILEVGQPNPSGPCVNSTKPRLSTSLPPSSRSVQLPSSVCLEPGMSYKVILTFDKYDPRQNEVSASVLIDSIVLTPNVSLLPVLLPENLEEFNHYRCSENFLQPNHNDIYPTCTKHLTSIGSYVNQGAFKCDCNGTGSTSYECAPLGGKCDCKPNVVGRKCDMCAPGTHSFGPNGCEQCDCHALALDNICDPTSGQCKCRFNHYGKSCDQCQVGFWNFPNCQRCECNGHAATCDTITGECINCLNNTEGTHCERCAKGYYGEPTIWYNIPCRPCQCPGTVESGNSHAVDCLLDYATKNLVCECAEGYTGDHCDECADNYFGRLDIPGEICSPCDCSGNVDINAPGNCDRQTGKCLKCLDNTEGDHCEICKEGYFRDPITNQCQKCKCELLGVDPTREICDRETGQCPCLPNVKGISCDQCEENHWKIASGQGCEPCNCFLPGSRSTQCDAYFGNCDCKNGFGGRTCNACEDFHWGDPTVKCDRCDCELSGSRSRQCDSKNGSCVCIAGVGGVRCDQCARGYLGHAPSCNSCGECFFSWDNILNKLRNDTSTLLESAANIKEVGVWGAYTAEFSEMEKSISDVKDLLNRSKISLHDMDSLKTTISNLQATSHNASQRTAESIKYFEETDQNAKRADLDLTDLRSQMVSLQDKADLLRENATKLQEANVEGALNLTRKARKDSQDAEELANKFADELLVDAERKCKHAQSLLSRTAEDIGDSLAENGIAADELDDKVKQLGQLIPSINEQVCGKLGVCDLECGGAGCGMCGGLSCEYGAVTKANKSLELVNKADAAVKEKESKADDVLRQITQIKLDASTAKSLAENAFEKSETARNKSSEAMKKSYDFSDKLARFIATPGAKPSEIRSLAEETKKMNHNLEPDQVKELSLKIHNAVKNLTNIQGIIHETNIKKDRAKSVKDRANFVKVNSEEALGKVQNVTEALLKAAEAQAQADKAIRSANSDIAAAERHLTQISSESNEAKTKSNETLSIVGGLKDRLLEINKKWTKNKLGAEEIRREADGILIEADQTARVIAEIQSMYDKASGLLKQRTTQSGAAKDRTKQISQRASEFYVLTERKENYLKSLEETQLEEDNRLQQLKNEMQLLSKQVEEITNDLTNREHLH